MKRNLLSSCLTAIVLAAGVSLGCAGCFATAFELPGVELSFLLPVCITAAVVSAALLSLKYGGIALSILLLSAAGLLLRRTEILEEGKALLTLICEVYEDAYGWGILPLPEEPMESARLTVAVYAVFAAVLTAVTVVRRKGMWTLVPGLLPLASIIVVTDTVPETGFVGILLAAVTLLALTQDLRREDAAQGNRLTLMAALPVAAAVAALLLLIPREDYVNQTGPYREELLAQIQSIPQELETKLSETAADLVDVIPSRVDLTALGDRNPSQKAVLEVASDHSGSLYLRGQDFDRYDGAQWTFSEHRTEEFGLPSTSFWTVTVTTVWEKDLLYLPYYPQIPHKLVDGTAPNYNGVLSYSVPCSALPENWRLIAFNPDAPETPLQDMESYLTLPEGTREEAAALLDGLWAKDAGNTEKADIIAALVTECAVYDRNPEPVPEGEEDFALWFFREAERGYCVHFATTATVLLRSAGVPARYVTGYQVDTVAGGTVTASEEDAHAWAEYYEPRLGCWIVLESTPADGIPSRTTAPTEAPTEATTAPSTEPETLPPTKNPTETAQIREPEPTFDLLPTEIPPTEPPAPEPEPERRNLLLPLLLMVALTGLALFQRKLRVTLRSNALRRGSPNERGLKLWQRSEILSRALAEPVPEELTALAEKAKFSQHTLTEGELQSFETHIHRCIGLLREKPWYRRILDQYLRVLY